MHEMMQNHSIAHGHSHHSHHSHHMMLPHLVKTIQHCEATCQQMSSMLLGTQDVHARTTQIRLLQDCAEICATAAKYLARHSAFTKSILKKCAQICEACARECARFPDQASQHCSQVCLHCARECLEFIAH